jgi:hypothetical protein
VAQGVRAYTFLDTTLFACVANDVEYHYPAHVSSAPVEE